MRKQKAPRPESLAAKIRALSSRYPTHRIFSDFVEMSALAISNSVDRGQSDKREERYLQIIKAYDRLEDRQAFPEMFATLTMELTKEPRDVLGSLFHELELNNEWVGQFFTPYPISFMMAKMAMSGGDVCKTEIAEHGFFTALEPTCGSGVMVIATAEACREAGINFQQQLHFTAIDIDPRCVHMTYVQTSLLGIPAVVIRGDSIRGTMEEIWHTPMHALGLWPVKLRSRGIEIENAKWWGTQSMSDRIAMLKQQGLPVDQALQEKPPSEVVASRAA